MKKALTKIINELWKEGKDYSNFRILLSRIDKSKEDILKDDILDLVADDRRIQLHTTPNNIAILMANLAVRNKPANSIDICCGTGNILYYLQNYIDDLTGVEIVENIASLTSYFVPALNIIVADTFKYNFEKKYDSIVGNIPWGMIVDYNGKRIHGEEAFVRKAIDLCSESGEVVLLVPYNLLIGELYKKLRHDLYSFLKEIIGIPSGAIRNTQVKTAILIFGKNIAGKVIVSKLTNYEDLNDEYTKVNKQEVARKDFIDNWDPDFHLFRESSFYKELENFKTVNLNELADIIKGRNIQKDKLLSNGQLLYLKPAHIKNDSLHAEASLKYINRSNLSDADLKCILMPGDIVISTIFNDLKMYVYTSKDVPAFASNNLAIIRSAEQDYILSYLQTADGKRVFRTQAESLIKGVVIPHLSIKDLENIKVPILPISQLNSLGNKAIANATSLQLEEALQLLRDYKQQIEGLKQENAKSVKDFINDRFDRIESQLETVNKKLDKILDVLQELKTDFDAIKSLPRLDEEKLFKMYQRIDEKLDKIYYAEKVTIENYIEEIKRWLDCWDLLDAKSQKFLPIAEFIFDELSRIPDADYAPFVVQYCRSLENEILIKLFEEYHDSGLKSVDRTELVKLDLENESTRKFATMVMKNNKKYTFGDMSFIMSFLVEKGRTLQSSNLLKHFRNFTTSYFDKRIVEAEFLKDIDTLVRDYRNKAAHPYSIEIEIAQKCQELVRKSLNVFLESIKDK